MRPVPRRPADRFARLLCKLRWPAAIVALVALVIAWPVAGRLQMNRSIAALFAPDDPVFQDYQELQQRFGGNAVAILVYRDSQMASRDGFARNREIAKWVESIDGVRSTLSPSKLSSAVKLIPTAQSMSPASSRGQSDLPALLRTDNDFAVGMDAMFAGYTHSADHQLAAVVVMLESDHGAESIEALKTLSASLPSEFAPHVSQPSLVGEPILIHDGFHLIERDGAKLATGTVALLSIVVLISLLDLRFVLLVALIILWSSIMTRATMVVMGVDLSLVSTVLTAIVTVIAVAAVLHLGTRYRLARARGLSLSRSTRRSIAWLLWPIFWTCATDAAGFAALTLSEIPPVRQFGMTIAMASAYVFTAIVLLAPAAMMLPGFAFGNRLHLSQRETARRLRKSCLQIAQSFVKRRVLFGSFAVLLAALAVFGTTRTKTETSFLNNFRTRSPIVAAYENVEKDFGGAGVWDILLPAPDELTDDYLTSVRKLQQKLRDLEVGGARLKKVLSLADADFVASANPLLRPLSPSLRLSGMKATMPVFVDALLTSDSVTPRKMRIMLRSQEHLPADQKAALIDAVKQTVDGHTSTEAWQSIVPNSGASSVTGYYVMMASIVSRLVSDQWRCFIASGVLVWLLLWVATGSLKLSIVALLPNLLPVFVVLACIGFSGGKINMGAAMIGAVSIGLSIDGSVHFLASYLRNRRAGYSAEVSSVHAAGNIGVPVLLATVALVVGFGVLATSEFIPTATFGVLVAATMTAGTLINLTLLPALVTWAEGPPKLAESS